MRKNLTPNEFGRSRTIGSKFSVDGSNVIVTIATDGCKECIFYKGEDNSCSVPVTQYSGNCKAISRADHKDIIFTR
jgi:hypothetical protein